MAPTAEQLKHLNYCTKCESYYATPKSCNCYDPPTQVAGSPVPYSPYSPPVWPQVAPYIPPTYVPPTWPTITIGDPPGGYGTTTSMMPPTAPATTVTFSAAPITGNASAVARQIIGEILKRSALSTPTTVLRGRL